jgi:integrase
VGVLAGNNPITHLSARRKKLDRAKVKLTDDQTRRTLAALPAQVRTLACVSLFYGLRISEVRGLQEKHLEFANGELLVEQRFPPGNIDVTKSGKDRRMPMGYLSAESGFCCLGGS